MNPVAPKAVFTVGHSTLSYEAFLRLLRQAEVDAVADVRSAPYSRHHPHFSRETLRDELRHDDIAYVYLGDALGGRPKDRRFFCDGVADYDQMAEAPAFKAGLKRVIEGASRYRIALMCSEHDPLDCHRCLLVGRALQDAGVAVGHILSDGRQKRQAEIEADLLAMAGDIRNQKDFFASPGERLAAAYRDRARKVAFSASGPDHSSMAAAE